MKELFPLKSQKGFPGGSEVKASACNAEDLGLIPESEIWRRKWQPTPVFLPGDSHGWEFDPWVGKMPWRRESQSTPVFLPGESHGQGSLVGYSPWSHNFFFFFFLQVTPDSELKSSSIRFTLKSFF